MIQTRRHEVVTVGYLAMAMMMEGRYRDDGSKPYKWGRERRVKDSVSRYVQELCKEGLMRQWPRVGQHGEYPLTLTDIGEKVLDEYGFPYLGRAKQFAKSKGLNAKHHLGMTRANLRFLDSAKFLLEEVEVLPGISIPYGNEGLKFDKLWKVGKKTYPVEWERTPKAKIRVEEKLHGYVEALKKGYFEKAGIDPTSVLWITPLERTDYERGLAGFRRLQELALKTELPSLFSFTCEQRFFSEGLPVNIITEPVWESADRKELWL
jgi:hypothetical protein